MGDEKVVVKPGRCLALYKAGENTAALWLFREGVRFGLGGILVKANFRAHGHGEVYVSAREVGGKKWVELTGGMNCDFGRLCDQVAQKLVRTPTKPLLVELAGEFGLVLKDEDAGLEFQNGLYEYLLAPHYEGVKPDIGLVPECARKGLELVPVEARDGFIVSSIVMYAPDSFRILVLEPSDDEGCELNGVVRGALKGFVGEFLADAGVTS